MQICDDGRIIFDNSDELQTFINEAVNLAFDNFLNEVEQDLISGNGGEAVGIFNDQQN